MLTLGQALAKMDQVDGRGAQVPFSITWCTLDTKRGTGGVMRTMKNMVRAGASHNLQRNRQFAVKPADGSGHNIPIHLRLLRRLNGEPVL